MKENLEDDRMRLCSCMNTSFLVDVIRQQKGEGVLNDILQQIGYTESFVKNTSNWIPFDILLEFFEKIKRAYNTNSPELFDRFGREIAKTESGALLQVAKLSGSLRAIIKAFPRHNRDFNEDQEIELVRVDKQEALIVNYFLHEFLEKETLDQCAWTRGIMRGIPVLFQLPPAHIEEITCCLNLYDILQRDYSHLGLEPALTEKGLTINDRVCAKWVKLISTNYEKTFFSKARELPPGIPNETSFIFDRYQETDKFERHDLKGLLVLEDLCVNGDRIVKKGVVYNAPYCLYHMTWEHLHFWKNLYNQTIGRLVARKDAKKELEDLLEIARQRLFKEQDTARKLSLALDELKTYSNNLEGLVAERTSELRDTHDKLLNAQKLLSRYVAPQLAEKILNGEIEDVWGHYRKKLTMLFSDIKDFTRTTDGMEPEDMADLLNEYLSHMNDIIKKHGGTLAQIIGDGLFVFFGAPEASRDEEHALRCVRMAIEMQQTIHQLGSVWFHRGIENPLEVRCGINTGMATVGGYGSEDRKEYTAMGMQVNLAARLEELCTPGRILISHTTWALVKDEIPCEEKGQIEVKGFHRPMRVYQVLFQPSGGDASRA